MASASDGERTMTGTDGRYRVMQSEKRKRVTQSAKWAAVASLARKRDEERGNGPICLVLNDRRRAIYSGRIAIHTKQVLYGTTGELKERKKVRTGRQGVKRPIYSVVLLDRLDSRI